MGVKCEVCAGCIALGYKVVLEGVRPVGVGVLAGWLVG